ncbi:MAG: prepilin peptidase [Bacilli bacterium]|nr:prepilin peptidase [Bacilli bacterium]
MHIYYNILIFIIGSVLGSFYTVIATRLPQKKSIIKPRSHCDQCGHVLSPLELIPILSYIFLLGRCHKCHKRIDITSTLVELFLGTSFLLTYLYYGFSYDFYIIVIILSLIAIIFVSDFNYLIILDSPLVASAILIIILKAYYYGFNELFLSIVYGLIMFGVMYLVKLGGDKAFGRESLGGGDIKLSFLLGLILGWQGGLLSIAIGSFVAFPIALIAKFKKSSNEIPFGPYLLLGLLITYFFYEPIINFILGK